MCISYMSHPQVIGSPGRIKILDHLLQHITAKDDVWVATGSEIADWYRLNNPIDEPGAEASADCRNMKNTVKTAEEAE